MSLSREVQGARRSRGESESMHTRREKSKSRITRKVGRIKGGVARRGRVFLNRGSLAVLRIRIWVEASWRERTGRARGWLGWKGVRGWMGRWVGSPLIDRGCPPLSGGWESQYIAEVGRRGLLLLLCASALHGRQTTPVDPLLPPLYPLWGVCCFIPSLSLSVFLSRSFFRFFSVSHPRLDQKTNPWNRGHRPRPLLPDAPRICIFPQIPWKMKLPSCRSPFRFSVRGIRTSS